MAFFLSFQDIQHKDKQFTIQVIAKYIISIDENDDCNIRNELRENKYINKNNFITICTTQPTIILPKIQNIIY